MTTHNENQEIKTLSQCTLDTFSVKDCTIEEFSVSQCAFGKTRLTLVDATGLQGHKLSLDGAKLDRVSLKNVTISHADCTGLIINGVDVGSFLASKIKPKNQQRGVGLRSRPTAVGQHTL